MKARLFLLIATLLGLMLVSTWAVSAQGPKPAGPLPIQPVPPQPASGGQPGDAHGLSNIPSAKSISPLAPMRANVALGQPGLSFRYVKTFGVTAQPYFSDTLHLNVPAGLFIDSSDNIYVTEERGYRVLKYNSAGTSTLVLGSAGLQYTDNYVFSSPEDVARDAGGNIWVADSNRVVQYSSTGTFLQSLPATNSWQSGSDNTHFNFAPGVAFDNAAGRMFVSDYNNHRVQVYTFSASVPVYSATIGVTGVSDSDNGHLNHPERLAVDSSGRLYIADNGNNRVQRCVLSGTWSCSTFMSSLNQPNGIALDGGGNVYVADSGNHRIRRCDSTGVTCSNVVTGLQDWADDVAVDSSGNIYVPEYWRYDVLKYTSGGALVGTFLGTPGVPYVTDASHLSQPWGVAVAADGSLYAAERYAFRLRKLDANGTQQWTVGQLGVYGSDNTHLGSYWAGIEGNLALDASGRVYVPDTGNQRIQVFNPNGSYSSTFGSNGSGNNQFNCPSGVAINPSNGDIAVVDKCNQRIQVYDSSWTFKASIGTLNAKGSDNTHFNNPWGDAFDASGNIYVGDSDNHRVQKCSPSGLAYACATFAGVQGVQGNDFGHLAHPLGIAVDSANRVYVADEYNNRVQVFDSSGAYLTSIGAVWGTRSGELKNPKAVAVDAGGNVYVTDYTNGRIQKFARGVPSWTQVNINGFGNSSSSGVISLTSFNNQLYGGTFNPKSGTHAEVWRLGSGGWSNVSTNGFGDSMNAGIDDLMVFNGNLYASTWNEEFVNNTTQGGQVWRSGNGTSWNQVVTSGFGDPTNGEIFRMAVFNSQIYASTWSYTNTHGSGIWRSSTGNSGDWTPAASNGFGDVNNQSIVSFESYGSYLYAGTYNTSTGGEVWRTNNGTTWNQVNSNGFGDTNGIVPALAAFNGYLFASTAHYTGGGAQVWRCVLCDGSDWSKVVDNGFGNPNTNNISALAVMNGQLYFVVGNNSTGLEVWRSSNGGSGTWSQVGFAGFDTSNNYEPYWDNSTTVFNNNLYIGTFTRSLGGQIWEFTLSNVYLPMVKR